MILNIHSKNLLFLPAIDLGQLFHSKEFHRKDKDNDEILVFYYVLYITYLT